jgi:hypothetical protein
MSGVVYDVDQISGDDDAAGFIDGAAEWKRFSGEVVECLDGGLGAGGAPFIEVDLRIGHHIKCHIQTWDGGGGAWGGWRFGVDRWVGR